MAVSLLQPEGVRVLVPLLAANLALWQTYNAF